MTTQDYTDPREKLYNVVKSKGYYTKSFDDFKNQYNNQGAIDNLYGVISQNKLFTKPKEDFYGQYFGDVLKKKEGGGSASGSDGPSISKKIDVFPLIYEREKPQMQADIRTPQQKAAAKMPEQKTIAAGFTQVQSPQKDETFRIEMTDDEATQKALESFKQGEHTVVRGTEDPIKELSRQINIKKYSYPEYKVAREKSKILKDNFFQTGEEARRYLENNFDKPDTNETKQLAQKRFADYKSVEDAVANSSNLGEASIKYAIAKGDEQLKYLLESSGGVLMGSDDAHSNVPMAMRGAKLLPFLMNKDLAEMADKNPQLKQDIKNEIYNFPNHYPEAATQMLATLISERRDEKGLNSSFNNIVGKETTDKIVDELIQDGTLPANYKLLYEKTIRPKLGTWQSIGRGLGQAFGLGQVVNDAPIKTSGIVENIGEGFENVYTSTARTIADIPFGGISPLDAAKSEPQQVFDVLKKEYETPVFEPKSLKGKFTTHGGQMGGFVLGLGGGQGVLKATGLANPSIASATMMVLGTHADSADKAKALFPGNEMKQAVYTLSMDAMNGALGKYLPGQQIPRLLSKGEGAVADVLKKMVDGQITTSAAKNQIMEWFGNTAKSTLSGAEFMGAISAADDALTQVLQGKGLNLEQSLESGWEGFKLGLISTPLLAGSEAALKSNKGFRNEILDIAENKDYYKLRAEEQAKVDPEFAKIKDDVIKNIDYVGNVWNEISDYNLSEKDKQKWVLNSLTERIKQSKAEKATDPTLKKKFQQEAKDIHEIKEAALNGIPEEKVKLNQAVRDVKELYDNDFLSRGAMEMLEKVEGEAGKPKFDDDKVKPFLKFLAQQANNITEDGKFNEGSDARKSVEKQYPSQLIDLANEMFPEYKKTAEDFEQSPTPMQNQEGVNESVAPSTISVIEPGGIKKQETTTIAPKENVPEQKAKISVILTKNETKETSEIPIEAKETGTEPPKPNQVGSEAEGGAPPISEPPKGGGVFSERPPTELSHKGLQDVANEFSLPDVKTRDTKTDVQLRQDARETVNDWAEKGQYGKNVEKLVERAEGGEVLTDKERVILEGHLVNVQQQAREIGNKNSPEYDAKLAEIKRLKDAGEKTRSEAGAALRIPAGGSRPKSVEDALVEAMDDTGASRLTEKQKETVSKEYEDFQQKKDKFDTYMAEREAQFAAKQAEAELNKAKSTSQKTKKTREDFVAERKSLKEELAAAKKEHEDWLKEQGIQKSGFGSLTGKEAKVIAKIVKIYAEEGITKLQEVVDKVFDEIKGIVPNIEKSDIQDVIAGRYAEKKPTRNELAATLRNLQTEQRLLDQLEQLEKGQEPKSEKKKIKRNQRIEALRKQVKDHDLSKIAQKKEAIKRSIEKVQEQIKKGDFAPPEKKEPIRLDREGHKLRDDLIKITQQRDARRLLWQRQNEGGRERALRLTAELANIPRTLMTIGDFSGLLRQNIFFSAGHPMMTAKNMPDMFRSFTSQKVYDRWFHDIEQSHRYTVAKDSRLALADVMSHDLSKHEEAFMTTLAEKIPVIGSTIVKGSERSYTMLLNKMRWDVFNYLVDKMETRGMTYENSPKQYKAVAEYVNNATGRSDFGEKLNRIAPILNSIFFSPRLIASRVNMLTYWAQPRFWRTLPKEARIDYFRNWASLLITGGTILALAKLAGADVEDDPRSSDFGKIKSGNTRWDIWGGAQPYVRVLAQVMSGQRKSTRSGKIYELNGDDIFGQTRMDVGLSFFRNKLAPIPGAAVDMLSGRTGVGDEIIYEWGGAEGDKEISIDQYVKERLLPMTITGTQEAIKDRGWKALFDVGVPQIFGIGTQSYDSQPSSSKKPKKQTKAN